MPIQPIKIPQNVYIEDRIIGPLTLRQIIVVCIGCGFSYALWASISKSYGYVGIPLTVMVWIPGALSALFAFVRVNDLSLLRICLLLLERFNKPSIRTWEPRRGISINIRTFSAPGRDARQRDAPVTEAPQKLEELSSMLDALPARHEEGTQAPERSSMRGTAEEAEATEDVMTTSNLPPRPVEQGHITASPLPEGTSSLDGLQPRSSIFSTTS